MAVYFNHVFHFPTLPPYSSSTFPTLGAREQCMLFGHVGLYVGPIQWDPLEGDYCV